MCFVRSKNEKFVKLEEDMFCYKLAEVRYDELRTYYVSYPIKLGEPIYASCKQTLQGLNQVTILTGQVVHAFLDCSFHHSFIERKVNITRFLTEDNPDIKVVILRCKVPKGAFCCVGGKNQNLDDSDDDFYVQVVASEIIPIEIVKEL